MDGLAISPVTENLPDDVDAALFDEDSWLDVMSLIEEGEVVPVIGPELVEIDAGHGREPLNTWAARALSESFRLPPGAAGSKPTLNGVLSWLARHGKRQSAYTRLVSLVQAANFQPPESLRQLAEITGLKLFLTTSFDPLLAQELDRVRGQSESITQTFAFHPRKPADLVLDEGPISRPIVYHLFGRLSATPFSYVLSDEDLLEFNVGLLRSRDSLPVLFDELENKNLLFLGLSFDDWLARFFLRCVRNPDQRLSQEDRLANEVYADRSLAPDSPLVVFLQNFSSVSRVYGGGGASDFVRELWQRWTAAHGGTDSIAPARRRIPPPRQMPEGAVFISYASEDVDAAFALRDGLEAPDLSVWFDMTQLKEQAGADYNRVIEQSIAAASLLILVISKHSYDPRDRYFRQEWQWAAPRAARANPARPFVLPVQIDDTRVDFSQLPSFLDPARTHISNLPAGEVTTGFREHVRRLLGLP